MVQLDSCAPVGAGLGDGAHKSASGSVDSVRVLSHDSEAQKGLNLRQVSAEFRAML